MSAYIITIDTKVTDLEGLAGLADRLVEAVASHGGKYIIRGGDFEAMGGDFTPARIAVAEFDNIDQVKALMNTESFTELRKLRGQFAEANVFIMEGV